VFSGSLISIIIVLAGPLLVAIKVGIGFVDPGSSGLVATEGYVQLPEEPVHSLPHGKGPSGSALFSGNTIKDQDPFADHIDKVDIMVDNEDPGLLSFRMMPDDPGDLDPLFDIEMGARLIEDIEVSFPGQADGDCDPLELATAQGIDRGLEDWLEGKRLTISCW